MGKQDKIRGANFRASLIFSGIQKIKREGLDRISVEIQNLMDDLANKKELDSETIDVLKNVYFNKKSKEQVFEDKMYHIFENFSKDFRNTKQDGINKILLTLSLDGDLYRKPKDKHCYPLKKTGLRINIIRLLIEEKNSISGKDIAKLVTTSYNSTTFAINRINSISQRLLDLPKKEKLIISRDRGGYKLNPLYPITQEL